MFKIIVTLCITISLLSCSDNKKKSPTPAKNSEVTSNPESTSAADKAITDWLGGKEWKAESGEAPMEMLRLYSDGKAEFKTPGNDQWSYKGGEFGWHRNGNKMPLVTWPVKKADEQSFTLFVAPTQKTFVYKFVKNL